MMKLRMKQLMKPLAIPLCHQNTVAKRLVIAIRLSYPKALHSHSAKSPEDGDISRWLTIAKSLVMRVMRLKCRSMNPANDNQAEQQTVRVFFALWPDASERGRLAEWQLPLQHAVGGRLMQRETLHATLVFVGEIAPERLEALLLAAQEASAEDFDLSFDLARYWGHNHIAYAAPSHVPPQLLQLVERLEERLSRHRFKFERRVYKPHVTLLRNAHWSDRHLPDMPPVRWQCGDFALVQSIRQAGLAHYRVLARFPLASSDA